MPFKIGTAQAFSNDSPEALFRDLRTRKVPGLFAHQADILRDYRQNAVSKPDVAFELPTGSGKTLVGLLLAEWRRLHYGERCVYLCTTNQLVHQVAEQAIQKYGISATAFTGSKSNYHPTDVSRYHNCETVAITSYSALFNVNPFFDTPRLIVLDDVHSAENYIASHWSIRVDRNKDEHKPLYIALVSCLKNVLSPSDYQRLTDGDSDSWEKMWVDKIPTPEIMPLLPEISEVLQTHLFSSTLDLRYPWSVLRDHMDACHFYVGAREILIRPLLPPTNTHAPFANAKQRVYMSATLGEGGELERLTGRKQIARLQVPDGWDKQGNGRRLFFFPEHSLTREDIPHLVVEMIRRTDRTLIIVPDNRTAEKINHYVTATTGFAIFNAQDIERSKEPFVKSTNAVAVVANRYDGIDLVDNECRLLVVAGLPRATNLQEQFIIEKMGAGALLNDRILTRTVQAFGRCTRSLTDYAAVVIWGSEMHKHLLMPEHRRFLHPELQAELEFGIDQADGATAEEFLEFQQIFMTQDASWEAADRDIVSRRKKLSREKLPGTQNLRSSVGHELEYQYAMWEGDYREALDACRKVLAELKDDDLRGYRALWNYLAGGAAWLSAHHGMTQDKSSAKAYFNEAQKATKAIRWLTTLSRTIDESANQTEPSATSRALPLVERLEIVLQEFGTLHDRKFAREEKFILENLESGNSSQFEDAHKRLGTLLGFDAGNQETSGAPDPWWIVDENLCFIFEDHSEATPSSALDVKKARQVATHPNWAREKLPLSKTAIVYPVLITPLQYAERDALPHLNDVLIWNLEEFRKWAVKALIAIREVRGTFPGSGDLAWRATAIEKYRRNTIDPDSLIEYLKAQPQLSAR